MSVEDVAAHMDEGLAAMQRVVALGEQNWRTVVGSSGQFYVMGRKAENIRQGAVNMGEKITDNLTELPLSECEAAASAYGQALDGSDKLPEFEAGIVAADTHFATAASIAEAYRKKLLKIQQVATALSHLIGETEPLYRQLLHEISDGGKAARPVILLDSEYRRDADIPGGETGV